MPAPKPDTSSTRPYYVFTAVVLGIGVVLSAIAESWSSFFVFAVLCGTAVWIATRVGHTPRDPAEQQASRSMRPSERRRQRREQRQSQPRG